MFVALRTMVTTNVDACFDKQVSLVKMCNQVVNNLHKIESCSVYMAKKKEEVER